MEALERRDGRSQATELKMNTTTQEILSILEQSTKRANDATSGPWMINPESIVQDCVYADDIEGGDGWTICRAIDPLDNHDQREINSDFIASARADLPRRDAALRIAANALWEVITLSGDVEPTEELVVASCALAQMLAALKGEAAESARDELLAKIRGANLRIVGEPKVVGIMTEKE